MAADNTVTLTEVSVPTDPAPNVLLTPIGPELLISFSTPPQFQTASQSQSKLSLRPADSTTLLAGISFHFNAQYISAAAASAMAAVWSVATQAGIAIDQGVASSWDAVGNAETVILDAGCLDAINNITGLATPLTVSAFFVVEAARPASSPVQGLLLWNQTTNSFSAFQACPSTTAKQKILVVIHGMAELG